MMSMKTKLILGAVILLGVVLIVRPKYVEKYWDIAMFYVDKPNPPRDSQGRLCWLGVLGDTPVQIPQELLSTNITYEGDLHFFQNQHQTFSLLGSGIDKTYRTNQAFKVTAKMPIEEIQLTYSIPDDKALTGAEYAGNEQGMVINGQDGAQEKIYPFTQVLIYGGRNRVTSPYNFNQALHDELTKTVRNALNDNRPLPVNYQQEPSPVEGLIYYQANKGIDPDTGQPWTWDVYSQDIFIHRNAQGDVKTYIKCRFAGKIKKCQHIFYPDNMDVLINLYYDRHYLPQWQSIQGRLTRILQSWAVKHSEKSTR